MDDVVVTRLYESFRQNFEIITADTDELLEQVFRLRYQVLCIEKRLPDFDFKHYPNRLEKDDYDSHSAHILLRHRSSNEFIGTVRLILADTMRPQKKLPIELHGQLDPALCDIQALPRRRMAEISRFLITEQFDRRKGNRRERTGSDHNVISREKDRRGGDRRSEVNIALALVAGVMRMSANHDIRYWFSVMDPSLNRLLGFYGLGFDPIGPPVNYHGIRRSYHARVDDVMTKIYDRHREVWEFVTERGTYIPGQVEP